MKIAFYIDMMYRGGAQRVMSNLVDYFHNSSYEVILINDFVQNGERPSYDVPDGVKRIYLRENLDGNKLLKNIERITALRKVIKQEKPDLVLSFLGRPNKRMLVATIGVKTKKVVSVRNDPQKEYGSSSLKKWIARSLFRLADGCVFQTGDAKAYFTADVQKRSKIIYNPVGTQFYEVSRAEKVQDIIAVGRLEPQKNHKMLINAFASVSKEFPNENLIIYGEGPLREELSLLCKTAGLEEKVQLPGNVSQMEEKLAKARLFVLPSDYEGMPNALMEAMTVGVPVISTDCPCGGPKMLVTPGKDGLLVGVNDEKELVKAMREVLSDEKLQESMGRNAKEKAKEFLPSKIYGEWEEYLNQVAEW